MGEYPHIRDALAWIAKAIAIGLLLGGFGQWKHHQGFSEGSDTAICAMVVYLHGRDEAKSQKACARFDDLDWALKNPDDSAMHKIIT